MTASVGDGGADTAPGCVEEGAAAGLSGGAEAAAAAAGAVAAVCLPAALPTLRLAMLIFCGH